MRGRRSTAALGHCLTAALGRSLAAGWIAALAGAAQAETFSVTTTANSGAGSLRQAILDANLSVDPESTITFTLPDNSTITLLGDLPTPTADLTLDANGAPGLTLAGGGFVIVAADGASVNLIEVAAREGDMLIGNGDVLRFTNDDPVEIAADISDAPMAVAPGSIVKSGTAILTLSGMNVGFTGDLTIQAGTVIGDTESLPGAAPGTGSIANSGVLVFDQAADGEFAGVISGSGSVEKRGAGNLTLSGANTFAGGTTVTGGTLTGSTGSFAGGALAIASGSELVFMQPADGSFGGVLSGAGSITKQGAGDLTLTGANTFTGDLAVEEGMLIGTSGSISGNVDLATGTTLVFDQPGTGTADGAITGAGNLIKRGAGTLSLTGANSFSDGTTVETGTLIVNTGSLPGDADIASGAFLVFDQSGTGTFSGSLSGDGAVEKRGAGTLTIDSPQLFTGNTQVTAGTLVLDGVLASPALAVAPSATLAGSGQAPLADANIQGTLSPGSGGVGELGIGGAVMFAASSRFAVDVNDADSGDRLDAGDVTIAPGAVLAIQVTPGDYTVASTAVVLDATSLTGAFAPVDDLALLDIDVAVVGTTIQVTLVSNGLDVTTIGTTPNQLAVGAALGTLDFDPDFSEVFENLVTLTQSEAAAALDSLSGEPISAFTTARLATAEHFQRMLHGHMRNTLFTGPRAWPPPPAVVNPTDVSAPRLPEDPRLGAWVEGHGSFGDLDGDENSADVDYDGYGGSIGLDVLIGHFLMAGIAGGYERTEVELSRDGDGDADTVQGGAYAAFASDRLFAGVSGRYGWSQSSSHRDIAVGTLVSEARGDFDSHDFGARAEVAVNALELGETRFEPVAAFEWEHLSREDFDEDGAGVLGLDVDSEELDSNVLQLGGRVRTLFAINEVAVLAPELRAFWLHEFGDRERRVEAAIGGTPFVVEGAEAPADSFLVGGGWSVSLWTNVRATADYDLRFDSDRLEHVGSISVRARF